MRLRHGVRRHLTVCAALLLGPLLAGGSPNKEASQLRIFWLPTTASTLIELPTRELVLIDSGYFGSSRRIQYALTLATNVHSPGTIDHYITTHGHQDHFGGITDQCFRTGRVRLDHMYGPGISPPSFDARYRQTEAANNTRTVTVTNGQYIVSSTVSGYPVTLEVLAVDRKVKGKTNQIVPGFCSDRQDDHGVNATSIALLLTVGNFRYFEDGDLTCGKAALIFGGEQPLLTHVDVYRTAHHGTDGVANPPALFKAIRAEAVVINNNSYSRKGGGIVKEEQNVMELRRVISEVSPETAVYQIYLNQDLQAAGDDTPEDLAAIVWNQEKPEAERHFIELDYTPGQSYFEMKIGGRKTDGAPPRRFAIRPE